MACCVQISAGPFASGSVTWNSPPNSPVQTANGATISGSNGSITVAKDGRQQRFLKPASGSVKFALFGNPTNFFAILTQNESANSVLRSVVFVDLDSEMLSTELVAQYSTPPAVQLPHLHVGPQAGGLAFLVTPRRDGIGAQIVRSCDGETLASIVPFVANAQLTADVTASQLRILHGGQVIGTSARPSADSELSPGTVSFDDAVLGGVDPSTAVTIKQVTITNEGNNCMKFQGVTATGPFSMEGGNLPTAIDLKPGDSRQFTMRFAPQTVGQYDRNVPIIPVPDNGDKTLRCVGEARAAVASISVPPEVQFMTVPLGFAQQQTIRIRNSGDLDVTIMVQAGAVTGNGYSLISPPSYRTIGPGEEMQIAVRFAPTGVGEVIGNLTFQSSSRPKQYRVRLAGKGRLPRGTDWGLTLPEDIYFSVG